MWLRLHMVALGLHLYLGLELGLPLRDGDEGCLWGLLGSSISLRKGFITTHDWSLPPGTHKV